MSAKGWAGAVALVIMSVTPTSWAGQAPSPNVYRQAVTFHHADRLLLPWDGRTSYNESSELCLEVYNGTARPQRIAPWTPYTVGPGFYARVCQAWPHRVTVKDGEPFRMEAW